LLVRTMFSASFPIWVYDLFQLCHLFLTTHFCNSHIKVVKFPSTMYMLAEKKIKKNKKKKFFRRSKKIIST